MRYQLDKLSEEMVRLSLRPIGLSPLRKEGLPPESEERISLKVKSVPGEEGIERPLRNDLLQGGGRIRKEDPRSDETGGEGSTPASMPRREKGSGDLAGVKRPEKARFLPWEGEGSDLPQTGPPWEGSPSSEEGRNPLRMSPFRGDFQPREEEPQVFPRKEGLRGEERAGLSLQEGNFPPKEEVPGQESSQEIATGFQLQRRLDAGNRRGDALSQLREKGEAEPPREESSMVGPPFKEKEGPRDQAAKKGEKGSKTRASWEALDLEGYFRAVGVKEEALSQEPNWHKVLSLLSNRAKEGFGQIVELFEEEEEEPTEIRDLESGIARSMEEMVREVEERREEEEEEMLSSPEFLSDETMSEDGGESDSELSG